MCGVATIPFVILYSKQRREWTRLSSSGCCCVHDIVNERLLNGNTRVLNMYVLFIL